MPPDFFAPLAHHFWVMVQAGIALVMGAVTIKFRDWKAIKEKDSSERRAKEAEIMEKLEKLVEQQQAVKAQVKNSHGTNLRNDLDIAIRNSREARDNSTQALKVAEQIRDSVESLSGDFRESKKEHADFRERHNQNAEEIHDLNKRVNALFSAQNKKENYHE